MVQTADGHLLVGTFRGLVRLDGTKATPLEGVHPPALLETGIVNLHLDRKGRLWVSTYRDLVLREGHRWRVLGEDDGWIGDQVRTFAERSNGDLLLTGFGGQVVEYVGGRLRRLPDPPGNLGAGYFAHADESGAWWVVQNGFIGRWDDTRWIPTVTGDALPSVEADSVACGPARDGGMWLVLGDELRKYQHGKLISLRKLGERQHGVWSLYEDRRGDVWICELSRGILRVRSTGELHRLTTTNGLTRDSTRFAFEDAEGNLWIGTSGGGLQRFTRRRVQAYGVESGLTAPSVRSITQVAGGEIWLGTFGQGIFAVGPDGGLSRPAFVGGPNHAGLYCQSLLTDRANRTWIGTFGQGLWVVGGGEARRLPGEETDQGHILSLFEDSSGNIWIGREGPLSITEPGQTRRFVDTTGHSISGVRCLAEDSLGILWLSNLERTYRLREGRFDEIAAEDGGPLRDITCLRDAGGGGMWLGSLRQGLFRWKGGRLDHVGSEAGLPVSAIHCIMEDPAGCYWMGSNRGVIRTRREDLEAVVDGKTSRLVCQQLDTGDGLPSLECPGSTQPVAFLALDGNLWFATSRGAGAINPATFQLNTNPPPIQIESVNYVPRGTGSGHEMSRGPQGSQRPWETGIDPPLPSTVVFPAGSRRLQFGFAALSYTAPEKVRYEVQVEGLDSGWHDTGGQRSLTLHDPPPGRYVFRVRAANNDGVWNESGAALAFTVLPHFWQTSWFRALVVLLLVHAGGTVAWWRSRRNQIRERAEFERARRHQEELARASRVAVMGELSASIAHELNQPLTAILSNALAARRFLSAAVPDLGEFREILGDIVQDTTRARDVIRNLRELVKKSDRDFADIDLNEIIHQVAVLLRAECVARNVDLVLDLAQSLPGLHGDRVQLQQVLLNLLMNAFDAVSAQPVGARRVTVHTAVESATTLRLDVSDRGTGIPPADLEWIFQPFHTTKESGLGMGLAISRSIVESHGGRLWAENRLDGGATFHVALPVAKSC
jgi:signal transduction histidine kinase/ligand-binding sensor domain-containing protein